MEPVARHLSECNRALCDRARELRNNATKQENHLWYDFLKYRPEQWYRQKIIGNFIVDFYCPKAKLVVELDGKWHLSEQQQAYDEERSAYLSALGLTIMRFQNWQVDEEFYKIRDQIAERLKSQ